MKAYHNQFIGTYYNAFSSKFCDNIINEFKNQKNYHLRRNALGGADKGIRDTATLLLNHKLKWYFNKVVTSKILPLYLYVYHYTPNFLFIDDWKIQRTKPTEGYHVFHSEWNFQPIYRDRILAYTLYLNDIEDGGETEFLYQSLRVKPQKGMLCIFPAYFTHTHRGNPPLSKTKYIMTGWMQRLHKDNPTAIDLGLIDKEGNILDVEGNIVDKDGGKL